MLHDKGEKETHLPLAGGSPNCQLDTCRICSTALDVLRPDSRSLPSCIHFVRIHGSILHNELPAVPVRSMTWCVSPVHYMPSVEQLMAIAAVVRTPRVFLGMHTSGVAWWRYYASGDFSSVGLNDGLVLQRPGALCPATLAFASRLNRYILGGFVNVAVWLFTVHTSPH